MKFECVCGFSSDDNFDFIKHTLSCEPGQDVINKPKGIMIGARVAPFTSEIINALIIAGNYYNRSDFLRKAIDHELTRHQISVEEFLARAEEEA